MAMIIICIGTLNWCTEMMILTNKKLKEAVLKMWVLPPGENTNWYRFSYWGYADAIAENKEAIEAIGLITSHGFLCWNI
jgi:hypothetical protein